jgi:hypothetical protein
LFGNVRNVLGSAGCRRLARHNGECGRQRGESNSVPHTPYEANGKIIGKTV